MNRNTQDVKDPIVHAETIDQSTVENFISQLKGRGAHVKSVNVDDSNFFNLIVRYSLT